MRETMTRAQLAGADLTGPEPGGEGDLYRSERFEILIRMVGDMPDPILRMNGSEEVRILEEDGTELDPEEVSVLIWERLEGFDAVIELLTGPLPEV